MPEITIDDIRAARETLRRHRPGHAAATFATLSDLTGGEVLLKAENLQHTGSFKVRGAMNRLAALSPDERTHGVIAASAGNHAQGVAVAARAHGVAATS